MMRHKSSVRFWTETSGKKKSQQNLSKMLKIVQKADEITDNFSFLDSWEERYQYIIDLGKTLPVMAEDDKTEANRVHGCMSQVWMILKQTPDGVHVAADSDAIIVRGLLAVIIHLVQGQSKSEITSFDFLDFFSTLGFDRQLSPNRRNGLVAFVELMRQRLP